MLYNALHGALFRFFAHCSCCGLLSGLGAVQDLKGNILVVARVRPLKGKEVGHTDEGPTFNLDASREGTIILCRKNGEWGAPSSLAVVRHWTCWSSSHSQLRSGLSPLLMIELLFAGALRCATGQRVPFTYNKVLGPEAQQQEAFSEVEQLVHSSMDGYRVRLPGFLERQGVGSRLWASRAWGLGMRDW